MQSRSGTFVNEIRPLSAWSIRWIRRFFEIPRFRAFHV